MRGVKSDNTTHKIISDEDILITNSSNINKSLKDIVDELNLEIQELRSNVRWLYKYGGVGGSGSGSSTTKLKASLSITYTDTGGNSQTLSLSWNASSPYSFVIKEGTKVTISATLTSGITGIEKFIVRNADNSALCNESFPDSRVASYTFIPGENQQYTALLNHSSTWTTAIKLYTKVNTQVLTINNKNSGNAIIDSRNYTLTYTLINYFPSYFTSQSITSVTVNNKSVSVMDDDIKTSSDPERGTTTTTLTLNLTGLLPNYGIYNVVVKSSFGDASLECSGDWVRKGDGVYIYAYLSSGRPLYSGRQTTPKYFDDRSDTLNFRLYPHKDDNISLNYTITLNIGETSQPFYNVSNQKSDTSYTVYNNNTSNSEVPITFSWYRNGTPASLTYYLYWSKPQELAYFFKDSGSPYNYYGALYEAITTSAYSGSMLSDSPLTTDSDGNLIGADTSISINDFTKKALVNNSTDSSYPVATYVKWPENPPFDTLSEDVAYDFMLSLGIKFYDYSTSNTILTIGDFILTKNALTYNNDSISFCIPKDDDYHLVQLYFKQRYSTSYSTNDPSIPDSAVCVFIDGIIESKFITDTNIVPAQGTGVQVNQGRWTFNHFGVAFFNFYSVTSTNFNNYSEVYKKYLYDIDPIIPVNYWQTWKSTMNSSTPSSYYIESSIYDTFSFYNSNNAWLNYLQIDSGSTTLLKFIPVSKIKDISMLTDLPIYVITPEASELDTSAMSGSYASGDSYKLNNFLYNTFTSFGENAYKWKVNCGLLVWENGTLKDVLPSGYTMYIRYLGSSTLLYSVKNFEIGTNTYTEGETEYTIYWTPDRNKFEYCEKCFNLKADVVDSSHSNNVIIGNFVNDIMTSPFNYGNKSYRPCLTGFPVLLFARNSYKEGENVTTNSDYLFLGIYSFNLARSSVHNLGYSEYNNNDTVVLCITGDSNCSNSSCYVKHSGNDQVHKQFAIGEVSGNLGIYDFTLFDLATINQSLLGDFFISETSGKINETIDNANTTFLGLFKKLAAFVKEYLLNDSDPIFNSLQLSAGSTKGAGYYFKDGTLTELGNTALYSAAADLEAAKFANYRQLEGNITCMLDPSNQFHRVVDSQGDATINNLYYLEMEADVPKFSDLTTTLIDLEAFVLYYVICMAFGMVDSVQKNLTFKGVKDDSLNYVWYLGFYDMDTAFGISNSGGETSFQAFSDWVTKEGTIIQDYAGDDVENFVGYDVPSSAAFLYAKYYYILSQSSSLSEKGDSSIHTPLQLWSKLRSVNNDQYKSYTGLLESAEKFKSKYISNYFGKINPLVWNLNFLYKYFSATQVSRSSNTDSELQRFHGTRTYSRIEYLDKRLSYLDVMFGFKNNLTIGKSTQYTIGRDYYNSIPNNDDIAIKDTAFSWFTKGISNIQSAFTTITAEARTPFVLQTLDNTYTVIVTNTKGEGNVDWSVGSNTTIGFWGSLQAKEISNIGYFLSNPNFLNTIKSKYLEKIKLEDTPNGITGLRIDIDCSDCPSVSSITVKNNTGNIKELSITGGTNLTSLTIESLKCEKLTLSTISKNCATTITSLTVTDTFTISSNTYVNLDLKNPSLNKVIYKGSGESISINGISGIKKLTIGEQNASCSTLTTLKVENCNQLQTLYINAPKCTTIELNTSVSFSTTSDYNTSLTTATLQVASLCAIQIPYFIKLGTITWSNSQSITAKDYAFAQNAYQNSFPDTITISGKYCFTGTPITEIRATWELDASCTDFSRCFYNCNSLCISNAQLQAFLRGKVTDTDLLEMFRNCPYVGEYITLNSENPSCFSEISKIWDEVKCAMSYKGIFFNTQINYWKDSNSPTTWNTAIAVRDALGPMYLDVVSLQKCTEFYTDNLSWFQYAAPVFVNGSLNVVQRVSWIFPKVEFLTLGRVCRGFIFDSFKTSLRALTLNTSVTSASGESYNSSKNISIYDTLFDNLASPCKFSIYDYGVGATGATYKLCSDSELGLPSYYKLMYNETTKQMKAYFSSGIGYSSATTLFYTANKDDSQSISVTATEAANMIKACCSQDCNYLLRYLFANVRITEDLLELNGTITGPTSGDKYLSMSGMFYCPSSSHTSRFDSAISFEKLFGNSEDKYRVYDADYMFCNLYVQRIQSTPLIKMVKNSGWVPTMQSMFKNAKWDNKLKQDNLFTKEVISQNLFYGFNSTNTPALPSKFFGDILGDLGCNCYYMFANSSTAYSNDSLQGYIPSDLFTYGDNKLVSFTSAASLFENCKIEFAKGEAPSSNNTDSNNDTDSYYYLFPKLYVQVMLGQSQAFHTLYPGAGTLSTDNFTIFEDLDNSSSCAALYKFPSLRFTRNTGDNYIFNYITSPISQRVTIAAYNSGYKFPNVTCDGESNSMKHTMETSLACCIDLNFPNSSISQITLLSSYNPIINILDGTIVKDFGNMDSSNKSKLKDFLLQYTIFKNGTDKWHNIDQQSW